MKMDVEFVRKLRKESAGRLRDRCVDKASTNPVSVCRDAKGKAASSGRMGEYHHLHWISNVSLESEFLHT